MSTFLEPDTALDPLVRLVQVDVDTRTGHVCEAIFDAGGIALNFKFEASTLDAVWDHVVFLDTKVRNWMKDA